jgi:hypothetical protein
MATGGHEQARNARERLRRHDDQTINSVTDPAGLTKDREEATRGASRAVLIEKRARQIETLQVGFQLGLNGLGGGAERA